ncbi:hypothetical protein [Paracoccus yeei]|uniref:hypothetical protein n=1 Tax=Paracoccus yeei TaxID=147645 RepID=UPI003BF885A7
MPLQYLSCETSFANRISAGTLNPANEQRLNQDKGLIAVLQDDFAAFTAFVQSGRGEAQRPAHAASLSSPELLATTPGLSDREIARRP